MEPHVAYRPSHFGLCVSDLERSLRFYCGGLGFAVAEAYDLDDRMLPGLGKCLEVEGPVALRSQMITNAGMKIELLHYRSPGVEGRPAARRNLLGLTHLSFHVDDLDAAVAHLVACGGRLLPETRQSPGADLVFLADPDGVRVELMQARG
jgi:lactoylglutathione lyase